MLLKKQALKKHINSAGYKMSRDPLMMEQLNRCFIEMIDGVLINCQDDGVKTVQPRHAVYKRPQSKEEVMKSNPYPNLKPQFAEWARVVQSYCHEQAVVLSKKV